jgi:hypothetical protein
MSLVESLRDAQDEVLSEASQALQRAHLVHYEAAGAEESRHRLEDLYDLFVESVADRNLEPICRFAETVSRGRFEAGFDIAEVQTAFNVLEEAIWHVVVSRLPAEDLAEATGLVGTVIGAGKDTLARTWVSLAAKRHVASLDLSALFRGATS